MTDRPFAICLDVAGSFQTFSLIYRELNASVSRGGHHDGHRENDPAGHGQVPGLGFRPEPAGPDRVQPGPEKEVRPPPSCPPGRAGQTTPPSSAGQGRPPPPPPTPGIRGHRQPGLRQAAT